MKVENYTFPKSSFLSIDKDFSLIVDKILSNNRLKKLLYYNSKDCLERENISAEESLKLLGRNIKITPELPIDSSALTYITITFDDFQTNFTNPEFRDNTISFDIVCHFDQWQLRDFQLRPYRIAGELDAMLNNKRLTGIGLLEFVSARQITLGDEFAGLSLIYRAIHGEEDKKNPLNPADEELLFGE